jgi:hypothetical protein
MAKTFLPYWSVEAYDDDGDIAKFTTTTDIGDAVEAAKRLLDEYPKVEIVTPQGSIFPHREWM